MLPLEVYNAAFFNKCNKTCSRCSAFVLISNWGTLNKKLKKIIQTTNEHSEQQAQFIQNISVQMEPTLNKLSASAKELQAVAPKQAEDVWTRVEALKQFTVHIQELSSLENTLMEPYEVSSFNVGNFSKKIVEKVKGDIQPEVNLVTDVMKRSKRNPKKSKAAIRITTNVISPTIIYCLTDNLSSFSCIVCRL